MKKQSVSKILELILDEVEAGRLPGPELIRQGRSSLKAVTKSLKAATDAAAASGKSGRKPTFDRGAIKVYLRKHPDAPVQESADKFGCSTTLISILRQEIKKETT